MTDKITVERLASIATVLFDVDTGDYYELFENETVEGSTYSLLKGDVTLATFKPTDEVIHADRQHWMLEDSNSVCFEVRPFFELDVTKLLLSSVPTELAEPYYLSKAQEIVNSAE